VVPDRAELERETAGHLGRLRDSLGKKVRASGLLIEDLRLRLQPRRIRRRINEEREDLAELEEDLGRRILGRIGWFRNELERERARLEGRSPLSILSRGYCIAERDGRVIRSAGDLRRDDRIRLRMAGGGAKARIEEVFHDKEV
jgi:exodeoxyribonuclease VII large subunit